MHHELNTRPPGLKRPADIVEVGWRTPWSPLTDKVRHLLELCFECTLSPEWLQGLEDDISKAGLGGPRPAHGALELFDRLALARVTASPVALDSGHAGRLCELVVGLSFRFGFEVRVETWGVDWVIPELFLQVYIVEGASSSFEVMRL